MLQFRKSSGEEEKNLVKLQYLEDKSILAGLENFPIKYSGKLQRNCRMNSNEVLRFLEEANLESPKKIYQQLRKDLSTFDDVLFGIYVEIKSNREIENNQLEDIDL